MTFDSKKYWIERYESGRNSGLGSYGKLAEYKAAFVNSFIKWNSVTSLIEFGCGDGNNLSLIECESITGLDVSENALKRCFDLMPEHLFLKATKPNIKQVKKAELVLSMDVLYHLIEDDVYNQYIKDLVNMSSKYIIIYSCNFESNDFAQHVRPRKFTDHPYLNEKCNLIHTEKNKYHATQDTKGSFSDWYVYELKK